MINISLLESTDRWKTRSPEDELNGFHIKVKDYNGKYIIFSWWDGKAAWEDGFSYSEFERRFEPWY